MTNGINVLALCDYIAFSFVNGSNYTIINCSNTFVRR